MTKNELIALASKHWLAEGDVVDAIRFVHDLLYNKAKKLKETEPYATVTIGALLDAALEVDDLECDVDEIMEGGCE